MRLLLSTTADDAFTWPAYPTDTGGEPGPVGQLLGLPTGPSLSGLRVLRKLWLRAIAGVRQADSNQAELDKT